MGNPSEQPEADGSEADYETHIAILRRLLAEGEEDIRAGRVRPASEFIAEGSRESQRLSEG